MTSRLDRPRWTLVAVCGATFMLLGNVILVIGTALVAALVLVRSRDFHRPPAAQPRPSASLAHRAMSSRREAGRSRYE